MRQCFLASSVDIIKSMKKLDLNNLLLMNFATKLLFDIWAFQNHEQLNSFKCGTINFIYFFINLVITNSAVPMSNLIDCYYVPYEIFQQF